jgi:hypothetical protein
VFSRNRPNAPFSGDMLGKVVSFAAWFIINASAEDIKRYGVFCLCVIWDVTPEECNAMLLKAKVFAAGGKFSLRGGAGGRRAARARARGRVRGGSSPRALQAALLTRRAGSTRGRVRGGSAPRALQSRAASAPRGPGASSRASRSTPRRARIAAGPAVAAPRGLGARPRARGVVTPRAASRADATSRGPAASPRASRSTPRRLRITVVCASALAGAALVLSTRCSACVDL